MISDVEHITISWKDVSEGIEYLKQNGYTVDTAYYQDRDTGWKLTAHRVIRVANTSYQPLP